MKANELMIGDWVCDSLTFDTLRVDGACVKYGEYREKTEQGECFMPIPLTEDILKANGFTNIIGYEWYYSTPLLRQSGIVITINSEMVITNWTDHNDNVFVEFSCAFVHELQHALRLCGFSELADNLKLN